MGHSSLKRLSTVSRGWDMLGVDLPSEKLRAFPGRGDRMDAPEAQQGKALAAHGHHPHTNTDRHCPWMGNIPKCPRKGNHC